MTTLSRPVGKTSKAVNHAADVIKVKKLLNGIPANTGGPTVKLSLNGNVDARFITAIEAFQKYWLGANMVDGLVEPGSISLEFLDSNSAANVTVDFVKATGATEVGRVGNQDIYHFVTPKNGKIVTLEARVLPDHALAHAAISWEGAKGSSGDPLKATLTAAPERKQVVRIKKADGTVLKEIRVWVVWCRIAGTPDSPSVKKTPTANDLELKSEWTFKHTIFPPEIITDANRPALQGSTRTAVPHASLSLKDESLEGGGKLIWDTSRQIKAKMIDPKQLKSKLGVRDDYPSDDVEGNDDIHDSDEDNNPYGNTRLIRGKTVRNDIRNLLVSWDPPMLTLHNSLGADGDTLERRLHFREFTRIDLGGKWHRISNFFEWRFHIRFRKEKGKWVDDGSVTAPDNDDWWVP